MGIKLGNMKMGNQSPIISSPFNIVGNMEITVSIENGQ